MNPWHVSFYKVFFHTVTIPRKLKLLEVNFVFAHVDVKVDHRSGLSDVLNMVFVCHFLDVFLEIYKWVSSLNLWILLLIFITFQILLWKREELGIRVLLLLTWRNLLNFQKFIFRYFRDFLVWRNVFFIVIITAIGAAKLKNHFLFDLMIVNFRPFWV